MLALAESFRAMDGRVSSARVPMPHKTLGERQCVRQSRTQSVLLLSLRRRPESAPRPCEIVGSASKTPTKRTARAGTRQAPHLKRHRTRGPGTVFSATRHGSPHAASPAHPSARAPATTAPTPRALRRVWASCRGAGILKLMTRPGITSVDLSQNGPRAR